MKFSKLVIFLSTVIIVALSSCDCGFDYEFKIYNNTDNLLKVEYEMNAEFKTITVEPHMFISLGTTAGYYCDCTDCQGSRIEAPDSSLYFITGLKIFIQDSLECKTDFNNEYNWEFEPAKKLGLYVAFIDSSDFEL
ncbi:hypothetical protein SDC9_57217 [bioreactor metagenome]|uniref:Lipoprotein n=1 Tax=bioreactor metagenome TaxID=1076179 RepID=A0A644X3Y9_9ZZZZ